MRIPIRGGEYLCGCLCVSFVIVAGLTMPEGHIATAVFVCVFKKVK